MIVFLVVKTLVLAVLVGVLLYLVGSLLLSYR